MRQVADSLGGLPLRADLQAQRKRLRDLEDRVRKMRQTQWHGVADTAPETDGWLLSYLDLLTLLLVMFVVMLAVSEPPRNESVESAGASDTPLLVYDEWEPFQRPPVLVQSTALRSPADDRWQSHTWPALAHLAVPDSVPLPDLVSGDTWPGFAGADPMPELPHTPVPALAQLATPAPPVALWQGPWGQPSTASSATPGVNLPMAAITAFDGQTLPTATRDTEPPDDAGPPALPPNLDLSLLGDGIDVIVNERSVSFRINNEILFALGQATLTEKGLAVLERVVEVLANNDYPITVEGHTDPVPIQNERFPSNWELSTYRATSVLRNLVDSGVDAHRLRAVGYADTQPIAENDTPTGRSLNRRVELILETPPDVASENGLP